MRNQDIARVLRELAEREQIAGEPIYKVAAYRTAAENICKLPLSVEFMAKERRLQELEGVGPAIARKIDDLVATGTFDALKRARDRVPDGLLRLTQVPGVGVRTARQVWQTLSAETFDDVVGAARDGRLGALSGVGPKTVANVIESQAAPTQIRPKRPPAAPHGYDETMPRRRPNS